VCCKKESNALHKKVLQSKKATCSQKERAKASTYAMQIGDLQKSIDFYCTYWYILYTITSWNNAGFLILLQENRLCTMHTNCANVQIKANIPANMPNAGNFWNRIRNPDFQRRKRWFFKRNLMSKSGKTWEIVQNLHFSGLWCDITCMNIINLFGHAVASMDCHQKFS